MKFTTFQVIIILVLSVTIAYGFFIFDDSHILVAGMKAMLSATMYFITLVATSGKINDDKRKMASVSVISILFLIAFLSLQLVSVLLPFQFSLYLILNVLLVIIFALICNAIIKAPTK